MVLEFSFVLVNKKARCDDLGSIYMHIQLLGNQPKQNEVLYQQGLRASWDNSFTVAHCLPVPGSITPKAVLMSLQLLSTDNDTIQVYQFMLPCNQQEKTMLFQTLNFPLLEFRIRLQRKYNKSTPYVLCNSVKIHQLQFPHIVLPLSRRNAFETVAYKLYCVGGGSTITRDNSLILFTQDDTGLLLDIKVIMLQNTMYTIQQSICEKKITERTEQGLTIEYLNLDRLVLAFVDIFLQLQKTKSVHKVENIISQAGITPQVLYSYALTKQNHEKIRSGLGFVMQKYLSIDEKSINQVLDGYQKISMDVNYKKISAAISVQKYWLSASEYAVGEDSERNNKANGGAVIQMFLGQYRDTDDKLVIVPQCTAGRIYRLQYRSKCTGQIDSMLLSCDGVQPDGLYELLKAQPLALQADQLSDGLFEVSTQDGKVFKFSLNSMVYNKLTLQTSTHFRFMYYLMGRCPSNGVRQFSRKADQDMIDKLKTLQKVVHQQQQQIEYNEKKIKACHVGNRNYRQLSEEELVVLQKGLRTHSTDVMTTVDDVVTDMMKTFTGLQMAKMLIQNLQMLYHKSMSVQERVARLRTEEDKLLDDQQQLIRYYTYTLQQLERKIAGITVLPQHSAVTYGVPEQSHYVAARPDDMVLADSAIPDHISNYTQFPIMQMPSAEQLEQIQSAARAEPVQERVSRSLVQVDARPVPQRPHTGTRMLPYQPSRECSNIKPYREPPQILGSISYGNRRSEQNAQ